MDFSFEPIKKSLRDLGRKITGKCEKIIKIARFTPSQYREWIKEKSSVKELLKENDRKEVRIKKLQERVQELEEKLKREKKEVVTEKLAEQKEKLKERDIQGYVSLRDLFDMVDNGDDITLSTKMGKYLAYLYDIWMGNGKIAIVGSTKPEGEGKRFIVWSGGSVRIISNADNFRGQVRTGNIRLNRTYRGYPTQDIHVPIPESTSMQRLLSEETEGEFKR